MTQNRQNTKESAEVALHPDDTNVSRPSAALSRCGAACALCGSDRDKLVDSHIIPRAFYEDLAGSRLERITEEGRITRYGKGVCGQFMCQRCEGRFQVIDDKAVQILKQARWKKPVHHAGDEKILVIADAFQEKITLNTFAASVLWRASASRRSEYRDIDIGPYAERFRNAFLRGAVSTNLLDSTGFLYLEYRGGNAPVNNQEFRAYGKFRPNELFKTQFGSFHCHKFGFPYGALLIRLGGHIPAAGFVALEFEEFNGPATLWSCNLSPQYPHLLIMSRPKNYLEDLHAVRPAIPRFARSAQREQKQGESEELAEQQGDGYSPPAAQSAQPTP